MTFNSIQDQRGEKCHRHSEQNNFQFYPRSTRRQWGMHTKRYIFTFNSIQDQLVDMIDGEEFCETFFQFYSRSTGIMMVFLSTIWQKTFNSIQDQHRRWPAIPGQVWCLSILSKINTDYYVDIKTTKYTFNSIQDQPHLHSQNFQ